jgi:hypothetical protein
VRIRQLGYAVRGERGKNCRKAVNIVHPHGYTGLSSINGVTVKP